MSLMRILLVLILGYFFSVQAFAQTNTEKKQKRIVAGFFAQQVKKNHSVGRSVNAMLKRYPEHVDLVVPIALDLYPRKYKQIITSAIHAEPALACDVIIAAVNSTVVSVEVAVSLAIEAEPAYAKEIIEAAINAKPENIHSIVRVAIKTDPFDKKDVVEDTMTKFPAQMLSVLAGAIEAIPAGVSSFVNSALNLFPNEAEHVVFTAVNSSKSKHAREIINLAMEHGITESDAIEAAIAGGATQEDVAKR